MVPLSRLLDASRLSVCIAIPNGSRRTDIQLTCHLLFPCLLYQSEFPTLLAMREIIASAICQSGFLPEPRAKLQILFDIEAVERKKVQKRVEKFGCLVGNHGDRFLIPPAINVPISR